MVVRSSNRLAHLTGPFPALQAPSGRQYADDLGKAWRHAVCIAFYGETPMPEILNNLIRHPSAWYGKDFASDRSWIVTLTPRHLEEIAAAVKSAKAKDLGVGTLTKEEFPL